MFELGNVQNNPYSLHADYTKQNWISNLQKTKSSIKIANNDKSGITFKNSLGTETANNQYNGQNNYYLFSSDNSLKDTITGFRERVTAFRLLSDEIADSRPSTTSIIKDLRAHTEEIMKAAESSRYTIYTDVGEMLKKFRKEIEAIDSFEGFLLGVHDKIVEFTKNTEFNLNQILEMERKIAEQNENSELGKFSLSRIRQEALKALRCQANVNPNKALKLLTN